MESQQTVVKTLAFFSWVRWKSIGQLLEVLHNLVSVIKGYYVGSVLVYCGAMVLNQGEFVPQVLGNIWRHFYLSQLKEGC